MMGFILFIMAVLSVFLGFCAFLLIRHAGKTTYLVTEIGLIILAMMLVVVAYAGLTGTTFGLYLWTIYQIFGEPGVQENFGNSGYVMETLRFVS